MKKWIKKIKQNNGFSLSELLVATIILLLTSTMLVTCINLAMKQLYKQSQESEAQMLCTTLSTAIQDELTFASDVDVKDTSTGKTVSFVKGGTDQNVCFYIATETEGGDPTDASSFDYTPVTDDADFAKVNLGKVYLATTDASGNITSSYGLVSTGAYNIENSSYGSLRASMQLIETDENYEVAVKVFNGSDSSNALATKTFYVGKATADRSEEVDVDDSADALSRTLIFDPNGGVFSDGSSAIKKYTNLMSDTSFTMPTASRLPGYEFKGWLDTNNNLITSGTITVSTDMTYVAQWNVKSYTASFYVDSSALASGTSLTTISGDYNSSITLPTPDTLTTLQKDGYEFAGWEDESGNVYPTVGATWTVTGNQKFVATWTPKKYTVSFYKGYDSHGNPETLITTKEVYYMDVLEFPADPTREHYDFVGWEYERAQDDYVTTTAGSLVYDFTKDMTFVAKWVEHDYTATFFYNLNGTRTIVDEIAIQYGKSLTIPTATVEGYRVTGWKYTYNSTTTTIESSVSAITYNFNKDMEFEAVLEPYYIAYYYLELNSETPLRNDEIYKTGTAYSVTLPEKDDVAGMTKSGYTFSGWAYTMDGTNWLVAQPGDTITITGDISFYGVWIMDSYTVTFKNGNTVVAKAVCDASGNISSFKDGYTFNSFAAMKTGLTHSDNTSTTTYWTLNGWYYINNKNKTLEYDVDGNVKDAASLTSLFSSTADVTVYAGWKNEQAVYELSDSLVSGNRFLIVGGNGRNDQTAMTNSGNNSTTTTTVNVRGDSICQYVLTDNGAANSAEWYASNASGGRLYIRKTGNNRYLNADSALGWGLLGLHFELAQSSDVRQWTYSNHELVGTYNNSIWYGIYDGRFDVVRNSSSDGNIYLYVKKEAGSVISFNGIE